MGGGSKLRRRCTTCLTCFAILILIGIVATIWIMLGQGAFKNDSATTLRHTRNHHGKSKEYIEKTHLDHLGSNGDVEFVKPLKISPLPLHDHDIIFDQMRNIQDEPPLRHHSGHFRHRQAEVWDPHPRYVIEAFGMKLLLELEYNDRFVSPDLHVTHVKDNFTLRTRHNSKSSGCYYTGKIKGDFDSDVAVSLCNGMTGYIRTSQDNYYIEPAEKPVDVLSSFLHRIKKIPHGSGTNSNDVINDESIHCETDDNHTIVEDDFIGEVVASMPSTTDRHTITKREIRRFDNMINNPYERTSREADWPVNYNEEGKTHEYFVKVLVVVDKSMMRYHDSEEELRHYVLILMSHAALLYRHASIGNSLSLSVVNIWMLDKTAFTNNNSQVMLRNFCEWQKYHAADRQHDMALLLTRDPICRKNANCDTLGVAEVGSVCNPSASCAIVRERGLSSSYTIAHELGHALGMPHDEVKPCEPFHKGPKYDNIMAKVLNNETKPWIWSECSKHFVTEFLESSQAKCLIEHPSKNYISSKFSAFLPGENFEVDKQCELEFGTGYRRCPYDNQPHCRMLWCTNDEVSGCKSNLLPWADGTACGSNYWCHHGECIPLNRQLLTPLDGGWGPWQPWSECSRSCGGGIKRSKRHCDSPIPQNGGAYCTGGGVQYVSCNTETCGNDEIDFREYQCNQFNGITKNLPNLTQDVQWVPKYGFKQGEDLCKLYCRVKNSNSYYLLKEKVIDGTKCGLNSFDVCVNAVCRPGGCDNKLNSKMTLDECGICGGDNSDCEEMAGNYNITMPGYNRVLRLPRGSSNIDIRQNANNDTNYLVLMDGDTGEYILNSRTMIAPQQKDVIFGGVIISYSGSSAAVERITTPKNSKLGKDLILGVLSVGETLPPDIRYRYIVSRENAPKYKFSDSFYRKMQPRYGWRLYHKQWSKCNSICTGTQYMAPVCVDLATNKQQADSYCPESEKEHQMQKQACNTHCQLRWNDVSRGPCSVNCGTGKRNIYYNCVKIDATKETGKYREIVDDKHCSILAKPPAFETCKTHCESTRWDYSKWSECSVSCGGGTQRRSAKCLDHQNAMIDDIHCSKLEKTTEQICNGQKCPVWTSRDWSSCSTTCGPGYRTRAHYCHVDGRIYEPSSCDPRQKPADKEECNLQKPCTRWSTGRWSECNAMCGEGVQTRSVKCENLEDQRSVPHSYCSELLKPNSTKSCNGDCSDVMPFNDIQSNSVRFKTGYKWITGAWTQCSKSCNGGVRSRAVACRNGLGEENEYYCSELPAPVQTIECNVHKCPEWEYGPWSVCDTNCEQRRQVTCRNVTGNFVEDSECDSSQRPIQTTRCACPVTSTAQPSKYRWKVGPWKQCSTQCGRGQRHRSIQCEEITQRVILVDDYCTHLRKPKPTKRCERYNCPFVWVEGPWSSCSATCGKGFKTRTVKCHKVHQRGIVDPNPLPDLPYHKLQRNNYCDMYSKPFSTTECSVGSCDDKFVWKTGPWRQCSHSCGKRGKQTRQVSCLYAPTGQKVQRHLCPKHLRPIKKWKCNQWKCLYGSCKEIKHQLGTSINKDYLMRMGQKSAWIYCYKMDTNEPDEYISLSGDASNFAENYDKRLTNAHSCPYDGRRTSKCDCLAIGPERSGLTRFWKVRLNITSLNIIGDDFTFSRQEQGMRVAYGTAGDCYSAIQGCSQGRFSIDLTGTSFKIADDVRWVNVGQRATSRIDISEKRVNGVCGGYCGNCMPDTRKGLQVEIT